MCLSDRFPILKRLEVLGRIIRWIALFEGVLAIIAVTVKVALLGLHYETLRQEGTDYAAARDQITKVVVLSVFVIQAVFALILHEGARKKILWMIKAWLFFSFLQLLIPMTMIFSNLFLLRNKQLPGMIWTMMFQVALAIFHGIEATFVISFHTKTETDLRSKYLTTIEYHKTMDGLDGIRDMKIGSDASIAINIEHEEDSGIWS